MNTDATDAAASAPRTTGSKQAASARKAAASTAGSARKVTAKKTAATKTTAASATAGTKKTAAKKTPAKKTPAKKTAAKKAAAKKTSAAETGAKKTAAKKTPAKKTAAREATVTEKATAAGNTPESTPATPVKKTTRKKTAASGTARKRPAATRSPVDQPVVENLASTTETESLPPAGLARLAGSQRGHNIVPLIPGGLHTLKGLDEVGTGAWNGPVAGTGERAASRKAADPPKVGSARRALAGTTKLQSRNSALDVALSNKGIAPETLTAEQYYAAHQDMALNGRLTSDPVTGEDLAAGSGQDRIISIGARKGYLDRALRNFGVNPATLTVAQYESARRDYATNQRITEEPNA